MTLRTFSESDSLPDRILLYASKGWGKTTLGALAPNPIMLMSRGETGYRTLRRNNMVPDAPFAICHTWSATLVELRELIVKGVGDRKTLVLDAIGGFERLCFEHICETQYKGNWGESGFGGFKRGIDASIPEITKWLDLLDEVNSKLKLRIILLGHSKIEHFDNPTGPSYDRYAVDCHRKTWEPLNGWADAVLFGKTKSVVAKVDGDNKGVGGVGGIGGDRVLYTTGTDAFEAKNKHDLTHEIIMPKKAAEMWNAIGPKLDAANKMQITTSKAGEVVALPTSTEQVGNALELGNLIDEFKMNAMIPKWCAHFKVKELRDLTDAQIMQLITKIKSTKKEIEAGK